MFDSGTPPNSDGTMTSFDPRTGEPVADFPLLGPAAVQRVVRRARLAQPAWGELNFRDRKRVLLRWTRLLVRCSSELAELISAETGKPAIEAMREVMHAVELLNWAARNAAGVLGRRFVDAGPMTRRHRASVADVPYGVVGVIGPSSYPLYTPMGSIAAALAAGNAVVFKPSELTPTIGTWLARSWCETGTHDVLYTVTGDADTGRSLLRSRVDKVSFAGSCEAARSVAASCAQSLTPVVITGAGMGAMLVYADADLDRAAEAAVYGAMLNAGQTPAALARVYVADSVFRPFLDRVVARAHAVRAGCDDEAFYGPMTSEALVDTVRGQVHTALTCGGRAVVGGMHSFREPFIEPVVLVDVPDDEAARADFTHGPVLVVHPVHHIDDALDQVNAIGSAISVSIFTHRARRAATLARRLRLGMITINSVFGYDAMPAVPIGGVGDSGYGRIHGAAGLREFARTQAVVRAALRPWPDLMRSDREPGHLRAAGASFLCRHRQLLHLLSGHDSR